MTDQQDRERIAELRKVLEEYCIFPHAAALKLVELGYTRHPEPTSDDTDPQAERYGRLIERGWIPPEEAKNYVRTGEPSLDKFWQAVNDAREGKNLNLTEAEFELFSAIENLGIEQAVKLSPDRVEAVAKLLYFKAGGDGWEKEPDKPKHYLDLGKETFRKTAHSILKLSQPELTPLLDKIDDLAYDIQSNWSDPDPRNRCREIVALTDTIRRLTHDQDTLEGGLDAKDTRRI